MPTSRARFGRALEIFEAALGPRHQDVAETWVQLTVELAAIGADDALPTFARAITIYDAGPEALRAVGGEAVVRPR